jgi:hypothetical protein
MLRPMRIKERLDEIAAELGAPPRVVGMTMEEWFSKIDDHCAIGSWSAHEMQLIEEMRRLRREYEHAKAKP